ncbi:OsmC family protein [Geodermatophilus sp. DSM 44513]|uniref:OsmC family protein n=1 Tax=Geodermatophilus sp. DSM 44513 TaxID=1528104 RepID=UPI001411BC02|nr:OsmC family protein [Geodermatophilus sp. DSM 44513]WNV77859.1 OsmC family protein [Geodermatophilus sp. DSM 44513]
MTGTFAGALTARRIDPTGLVGHARGEVELEGRVLVVKRIAVTYTGLEVADEDAEKVQRVLAVHADGCPVARSLRGSIEITTRLG